MNQGPVSNSPETIAYAARELLDAGMAASRANDSTRALSLFAQAGATAPGWALPHFLSGSEYAALGQWAEAEVELANAVLLEPGLEIARYQLGLLQFSSGRSSAALVTWQPLAASVDSPWLADFVQAFAALAQDDFPQAKACFGSGLRRDGVNPAVASDIEKVLAGMAAQRPPQAAAGFAPSKAARSDASSHVLVANYDKFKLH
ncbi:hypothetical protein GCM10027034_16320 [Ramlibacter solisilvae]|uniref:Uncharacterized protein n=1 Tax=Ramlibacter tataouinensis TaxID=94132 RepID=A0A127JVZ0_9BURK|nr:hypothetical protein [Ramlibacter tataouinensis]AMO24178.1 hypothetical protein UC35_16710 [Ramlibacter tataouinensis]